MTPRLFVLMLLLPALTLGAPQTDDEPRQDLLLVGMTLIDGSGAEPSENAWLRVSGDRIAALGQGVPPSTKGGTVLDLQGKTVIPGLADMHVHLGSLASARWMMKLFLAHGITTVKDAGNSLGNISAIRRWMEKDDVLPHYYAANTPIQGSYTEQRFLQKGGEIEFLIDDYAAFGVDFIKVYNWLSSGGLVQVASLAKKEGLPVIGHTPLSWSSIGSIDAGVEVLEHLRLRPYEVVDDLEVVAKYPVDGSLMKRTGFWAHVEPDGRTITQTLDAWEKRKDSFYVTPTLVVHEAVAESYDYPDAKFEENASYRLLSQAMLDQWKKLSPPKHYGDLDPEEIAEAKAAVGGMATFVRLAHPRGIRILAGTDTPVPWLVPGLSLHRELAHFVNECGMSPLEALHTSTGRPAEALKVPDRGTIKVGHVADLVIVDGNPGQDIDALSRIEKVILAGRVHERSHLLKEAAKWAAEDLPDEDESDR